MSDLIKEKKPVSIWWFAFGYFAAYLPYSLLTKALTSDGFILENKITSGEILPITVSASVVSMLIFITSMRWWQFAAHSDVTIGSKTISLPRPTRWTLFSGICTGFVVVTTTLAYTIEGVSIVFAMLLMRGGMLIMSPIIDTLFKRHVRWFSWIALLLSISALVVNFAIKYDPATGWGINHAGFTLNIIIIIDVIVYLMAYFVRLTFMTKLAKSDDPDVTKKYFVEEQMVGTPFLLLLLFIASLFHNVTDLTIIQQIHNGFTSFFDHAPHIIGIAIVIGICSQFTGVFGGLILLDKSENAFAVPVNRCSSVLAGVFATILLVPFFEKATLPGYQEFVGAALIVLAILFLTVAPKLAKRRAQKRLQNENS
ncbi:MAG: hypothetical protein WC966_03155 [Bradymonadales bacterium]